jgi:hypothetical protein
LFGGLYERKFEYPQGTNNKFQLPPPPPPIRKRFLAFLFAAALSAALTGCNGESGSGIENSGVNPPNNPGKTPATADCTVSYQTGNGTGSPPKSQVIKEQEIKAENNTINLPDDEGLTAPEGAETAAFVGWNDGTLTYPKGYTYTVTKNVTFNARWAFTTLEEIKACLNTTAGTPVVIAIADADSPAESGITWQNLLTEIETAGNLVELDLSGSTLALVGEPGSEQFDYTYGGDAYQTGAKYIKNLVLPNAATSIKTTFYDSSISVTYTNFLSLEAVSGLNVSAIPDNAFWKLLLAAAVFPAAKTIGTKAFISCTSLTSVSLPVATEIGYQAFHGCSSLTSVSLPKAETIGNQAFYLCTSLTSVSLPAAKTIIDFAFNNCNSLTSVSLPKAETIGNAAFYGCNSMIEVSMDEATKIGNNAFYGCTSLTSVSLPKAETIDYNAFYGCYKLTGVSLPKAETIGTSVFYNCTSLTSVCLPAATAINGYTFYGCTSLTSVSLPKATKIDTYAFAYCFVLTVITIEGNCTITDNTTRDNFQTYYNDATAKAAGVYTYNTAKSSWSYTPLPAEAPAGDA